MVPFQVDNRDASARFSTWLNGLWFRPNDLKKRARVTEIRASIDRFEGELEADLGRISKRSVRPAAWASGE